jgi:hypothetical protein
LIGNGLLRLAHERAEHRAWYSVLDRHESRKDQTGPDLLHVTDDVRDAQLVKLLAREDASILAPLLAEPVELVAVVIERDSVMHCCHPLILRPRL